jgi:hypothetical protein
MEQQAPALHDFTFRNIWALDQPPLAGSLLAGNIRNVVFDNVKYGQTVVDNDAAMPLLAESSGPNLPGLNVSPSNLSSPVHFDVTPGPTAEFAVSPPVFKPGDPVTFTAHDSPHTHFTWRFGDGTQATGRKVRHRFPDAYGTQLDGVNGAGRFRVVLHATDNDGREDWAAQGVVAVAQWHDPPSTPGPKLPGLAFRIYPGPWPELPDLAHEQVAITGEAPSLNANAQGFTKYAVAWDGFLDIPADGGYTFHVMARDGARLVLDGIEVARTGPPFAQVCGSPGNAMRYDRGSLGLRAGLHTLHVESLHNASQGPPRLLWKGPGLPLTDIPQAAYSHPRLDTLTQSE